MNIVKLNQTTLQVLSELKEKISNLEKLGSNIDVAWALESIHNRNQFLLYAQKIKDGVRNELDLFPSLVNNLKKSQILVTIDSEEKQKRAIDILSNYKEQIWKEDFAMDFDSNKNKLVFATEDWFICYNVDLSDEIEISLDQLEELLKNKPNE